MKFKSGKRIQLTKKEDKEARSEILHISRLTRHVISTVSEKEGVRSWFQLL